MSAKAGSRKASIPGRTAEVAPTGCNSVRHLEQVVTLEVALYLGAVALGLLLRLLLIDVRPLSVEEGTLALEAHRIWLGQTPETLHQGPLIAHGTSLALAMFAGGDGAARVLPALSGAVLVAVPYLLRSSLGRVPSILAAFGIALSPLMLFASRDVAGGMVPITLGALLWSTLDRGLKRLERGRAYGAALLVAGLVASGDVGITVLVTLGAAALLSYAQPSSLPGEIHRIATSPVGKRSAIVLVGALLVVGSDFGSHFRGIQWTVVDVWGSWAASFSLGTARGSLLLLLALYELPILALGLAQLFRAMLRRDRVDSFLALWAMLLLLFAMVQDTGTVSRLILPILPLYLLAARLAAESLPLVRGAGRDWRWSVSSLSVAVPLGVGMVLLNRGSTPATDIPAPFLYVEAALAIVAVLLVGFLLDGRARLSLAWFVVALASVAYLLHGTAFVNYRMDSLPREPLVGTQIAPDLREAALAAAYFSAHHRTPVTVDPQLRAPLAWYLREARDVQYATQSSQGISLALAQPLQESLDPATDRIPGLVSPSVAGRDLTWQEAWRWVVGRDGLVRVNQRDIIVRAPAGNW
ncbi:MAG: hypothetical protein ACYC5J_02675 [Chloroflexota bacterium]